MISAELSHNPYLQTTEVLFNGLKPGIYSRIEKYLDRPLAEWVEHIPEIFRQEMNGFGFELQFTGTTDDFEAVKKAFGAKNVALVHKKELHDVPTKTEELSSLLSWLETHPCTHFSFRDFWGENSDFFTQPYPIYVICSDQPSSDIPDVRVDTVRSAAELRSINLHYAPVVFYIENESSPGYRRDLPAVMAHKEFSLSQLFFVLSPSASEEKTIRVLQDMGVPSPAVIRDLNDETIVSYLRHFPIREFVHDSIIKLDELAALVSLDCEDDKRMAPDAHKELQGDIDLLTQELQSLRSISRGFFETPEYYYPPKECLTQQRAFIGSFSLWKGRQTKASNKAEAESFARDLVAFMKNGYKNYERGLRRIVADEKARIDRDLADKYRKAGIDTDFTPEGAVLADAVFPALPELLDTLMLKNEVVTDHYHDDAGWGFLHRRTDDESNAYQTVIWPFDTWRNTVRQELRPVAAKSRHFFEEALNDYYQALNRLYLEHLNLLINERETRKDAQNRNLTGDELRLQQDSDWLDTLKEMNKHLKEV